MASAVMDHPLQPRRAKAFSIIELLMALSICATLLVSVAFAVRAMSNTVNANEWYARLTLKGRNVMMRLIDQARTADAHGPKTTTGSAYTGYTSQGKAMTDIGIAFADAGATGPDSPTHATVYTYWWDQGNQKLMVQTSVDDVVQASGTMLDGVTNFQVTLWPATPITVNGKPIVPMLRATFLLTYTDTDPTTRTPQTVTLTGSVVPRKIVWTGRKLAYPIDTIFHRDH